MRLSVRLMLVSLLVASPVVRAADQPGAKMTADAALARLMDGNKRFVAGQLTHPDQTRQRRESLAKSQTPFAVILSCSDSRVPPEIVFDAGLGNLFVVRVAGNVVDDVALGSIEYAVEHLGAPLVMVLGHERCGAVTAATQPGEPEAHIKSLVQAIKPAVDAVKGQPGDLVDNAIAANVRLGVKQLGTSREILGKHLDEHKLTIVGARYDLDTGAVEIVQ
ncbi:MAG: carbonic anhydrase [Candidatus Latescibacteria bacterium]|nr:carbonic anhydrase [Candidatus Latescibacterota bacterium]